jgi:nicotinate-nucleotide pyrophosphorylase (carboxylating)
MPGVMPPANSWRPLVERALGEDLGSGDLTSALVIPESITAVARIEAREPLIVCGIEVALEVFRQVDPDLRCEALCRDGDSAGPNDPLIRLRGSLRAVLAGERSALNFLARLCGIASQAARFVEAVAGTRAQVVDTRKTLPGWRVLDKYAVTTGGAQNHRTGLFDGILIKDNHINGGGGLAAVVKTAVAAAPAGIRPQIEVQSEAEAEIALDAGADFLLLDNCSPEEVRQIVNRFGDRALLEASGGIDLDSIRAFAATGVHRISSGALTHSVKGSDVALEIDSGAEPQ